jgi:hypothetical protein
VEAPKHLLQEAQQLGGATGATVGKYTARRDPPHFQGDEYHAHAEVPGGYEIGGDLFLFAIQTNPAEVPKEAKSCRCKGSWGR